MELSDEVFRFFVCTVCPVKDATAALRYFSEERAFHGTSTGQTVAAPALGFLFPAFDDRRANIYDALYYSHDTAEIHPELSTAVPCRTADVRRRAERDVLRNACRGARYRLPVDVVQAVHENLRSRIEEHKEAKDPDALEITARDVVSVLRTSGVPLEKTEKFERECEKRYGTHAALDPNNIVESQKARDRNAGGEDHAAGRVWVSRRDARDRPGRKYILIPADGGVEVNGIGVNLAEAKKE